VPWDLCGRAVDFIRTPYRFKLRPYDHPDAPVLNARWYFTDLDFLPFPTVFGSAIYRDRAPSVIRVGEIWRPFFPYSAKPSPDGLIGDHFCGSESDFLGEAEWPYTGEPVERDEDGIPFCCRRIILARATIGASAHALVELISPLIGGATIGASAEALVELYSAQIAGATIGAGAHALVERIDAQGGTATGGASAHALVERLDAQGGTATGGASAHALTERYSAQAGNTTFGASAHALTSIYPLPAAPGVSCFNSGALTLGVPIFATATAGEVHWWGVLLPAGPPYRVRTTLVTGPLLVCVVEQGTCDSGREVGKIFGTGELQIGASTGEVIHCAISGSETFSYSLLVERAGSD
jgi:hypothetical protein